MYSGFILFEASNGNKYELSVLREDDGTLVPSSIWESADGWIFAEGLDLSWESLSAMTRDLKIEITSWGSDVGN